MPWHELERKLAERRPPVAAAAGRSFGFFGFGVGPSKPKPIATPLAGSSMWAASPHPPEDIGDAVEDDDDDEPADPEVMSAGPGSRGPWGFSKAPDTPGSGVRLSEARVASANDANAVHEPKAPSPSLSYQVYTVADLDKLRVETAALRRATMLSMPVLPGPAPSEVLDRGFVLIGAASEWAVASPRPPMRTALGPHAAAFVEAVRGFVRAVDWKRAGIGIGAGLGTVLALVFVVLSVAELTDDLHAPKGGTQQLGNVMDLDEAAPSPSQTAAPALAMPPAKAAAPSQATPVAQGALPAPSPPAQVLAAATPLPAAAALVVDLDGPGAAPAKRVEPAAAKPSSKRDEVVEVFNP